MTSSGSSVTDLVQVGQAVGVLAEALVLSSESVSSSYLPELLQIHHIQGAGDDKHASKHDKVKAAIRVWKCWIIKALVNAAAEGAART